MTLGPGDHGVRDGGAELPLGWLQRLPFHPGHKAVVGSPFKDCSPVCVHDPVVVVADVTAEFIISPRLVARCYLGTLHCLAKREPNTSTVRVLASIPLKAERDPELPLAESLNVQCWPLPPVSRTGPPATAALPHPRRRRTPGRASHCPPGELRGAGRLRRRKYFCQKYFRKKYFCQIYFQICCRT